MAVYKTIFECLLSWFLSSIQLEFFLEKNKFFHCVKKPLRSRKKQFDAGR